jgi:hypothetical protein
VSDQFIGSPRRYYLQKRQTSAELGDKALELVWMGKQLAEPETALPADFPYLSTLEPLGYVAVEDLLGADECELRNMGLTSKQAESILAAFAAL